MAIGAKVESGNRHLTNPHGPCCIYFLDIHIPRPSISLFLHFVSKISSSNMAEYTFTDIEKKWQEEWEKRGAYRVSNDSPKPKYYVLDMFPYPSGAGLHVGHPLGYIASDIVARFKRLKGFNVLHPMGFDAFGLPAEQYAIQTGQHPEITTKQNIETYKKQLKQIGFSYDWDREVVTADPSYYKWTQWIFIQLFNSWYNTATDTAEPIDSLIREFEARGNAQVKASASEGVPAFSADAWAAFDEKQREDMLQHYRLAYLSEQMVNWCAALGTVLSNDEVKDGVSERGGYPVERKKMWQWCLRITAYADRLLTGLESIDWPEAVKEMQRNWIGKSIGAEFYFEVENSTEKIDVFTTRIDTVFGVSFLVLAPEHELVGKITQASQQKEVMDYVEVAKNRSERERMSEVKRVSGAFTGAYALHPFSGERIPVWISDYVLAGYGTGAVMAVPGHDERDHRFAKHFGLPIPQVVEGPSVEEEAFVSWDARIINSDFMNGLTVEEAIAAGVRKLEEMGIGKGKVNFRLRDAIFGRQRYWGEPFPVYYKNGIPQVVAAHELPVTLPEIDEYKPTETGEPPLARAKDWGYVPEGLTPGPSPKERGEVNSSGHASAAAIAYKQGWDTANPKVKNILLAFAKNQRQNPTQEETRIWDNVRSRKLGGFKIRRQHPIGDFIADFVCLEKMLVIEIDGEIHLNNKEYDEARTTFLNSVGFDVIRFSNKEVQQNLSLVLKTIRETLENRPSNNESDALSFGEGWGEEKYPFELTTMPGWAGSSWYWFRYMDPKNTEAFVSKEAENYWQAVDLYMGGAEHATGHLLYARFWCKVLHDLGLVQADEPFKKLINQGMIQGRSNFVYRLITDYSAHYIGNYDHVNPIIFITKDIAEKFINGNATIIDKNFLKEEIDKISKKISEKYPNSSFEIRPKESFDIQKIHVDVNLVSNDILDTEAFKKWRPDLADAEFLLEDGKYHCGAEVEKMSKSKHNVVNPDDIIARYGADTLRMYEMFLGPIEQAKPWNTNGIDGVYKFLRKLWNLFHDKEGAFRISEEAPTKEELKALHKVIKKVQEDIEKFSFNTSVSTFMICVNELSSLKCNKRSILEDLLITLSPFAPHIAEELWHLSGKETSILDTRYPVFNPDYLAEDTFEYPVSINGKTRAKMSFALDMPVADIEKQILASEVVQKWLEGKPPKKVIIVPNRIVNIVV
jgi:leucyl-tRNA synthetase